MAAPQTGLSSDGKPMHYSVGAFIKHGDTYLLIDRVNPPYGFAGLAGHVDEGEEPEDALRREVAEESGLQVAECTLLGEGEVPDNTCTSGVSVHYWYVYSCETEGDIRLDEREAKSVGWYTAREISDLELEPVWRLWFEKLGII